MSTTTMKTRAEHLAWAKVRAHEYIDRNDLTQAFMSMTSDLNKHDETRGHLGVELGTALMLGGGLSTPDAMRRFIDGFN